MIYYIPSRAFGSIVEGCLEEQSSYALELARIWVRVGEYIDWKYGMSAILLGVLLHH